MELFSHASHLRYQYCERVSRRFGALRYRVEHRERICTTVTSQWGEILYVYRGTTTMAKCHTFECMFEDLHVWKRGSYCNFCAIL